MSTHIHIPNELQSYDSYPASHCTLCGKAILCFDSDFIYPQHWMLLSEALTFQTNEILKHADRIFVRELVKGRWGSYALSELSATQALTHALRWIREGIVPLRRKTEEEMRENQSAPKPPQD